MFGTNLRALLLSAGLTGVVALGPGQLQAQVPGDPPPMFDGVYRNVHWPAYDYWFTYGPPLHPGGYKVYAPSDCLAVVSYYVSPQGRVIAGPPHTARITVRAPAAAEIFIEDKATQQKGTQRDFISPPLKKDREYTYDIRAEWKQGDQVVRQTKSLTFKAGDKIDVDFTPARPELATARK